MSSDSQSSQITARKMLLLGLVALLVAALLNADQLVREAESKPFGRKRDYSLAVWEPVQQVSDALYLNRPRMWVDNLRGREFTDPDSVVVAAPSPDSSTADTAPTTTSTTVASTSSTQPVAQPSAPTTPPPVAVATTVPEVPRLFVPTEQEPLQLWVGGDSMAAVFGNVLVREARDTGVVIAESESTLSSGLARPDYLNWPDRLTEIVETQNPDVMVLILGANDVQGMLSSDGEVIQIDDPAWDGEYRLRVREAMARMSDERRLTLWVGQPVMRSEELSQNMQRLNGIFELEAAANDDVEYVESWDLFTDSDGNYADLIEVDDGKVVDLRLNDGIHLTTDGGLRLTERVLQLINDEVEASK